MKKKRIIALLAVAAMTVGMLAGCGSKDSDSKSSGGSDSGKKEKLTLWMPTFASTDGEITDQDFWDEKAKAFGEENNCEVKVEIIPWDNYEEKYLTGTTSDDGPDIGYMYMEMFYDYIDMGALVDVDQYFTDEEKSNYLYYDLGNLQGGQYALPIVVGNPRIVIANMDILSQAGIDKVPASWDELVEACKAIKEKVPDVNPFMQDWGNTHYGSLNEIYWPYFWGAGGEIVDEDGNLTINTEAGKEATEFLYSLKEDGILPESCTANDDTLESFKNGESAIILCASSNALKIEGINWDFTPLLAGPKDSKTFVAADSLVMFEKCANKELAAKLMKYLTSAEVMSDFHQRVSEQPPITADEEYTGDERYADLFSEYGDNFQALPVFKGASSMYDTLYKNLQSMMLGQMTPEQVLQDTTDYYDTNLK
ncbi:MAG TPA: sugar ABC transporter substrate-binding protein [Lachnospiraceae bacterium]|nr:sugar ABC transporter substrate-binding protein [Lachnospiraceae bacterium]